MLENYLQSLPVYLQILHGIRQKIASGAWPPGMRVPPVRELSVELGVNPNTAQRSLAELEREGLVYSERTAGRFITTDIRRIQEMKRRLAEEYTEQYRRQMRALGYEPEQMEHWVRHMKNREEGGQ